MEEIIKKANELGLMIKGTEISARFEELSNQLEADIEAKKLLEEYAKISQEFHEKESKGEVIEVDDKKMIQELNEKVAENQLLKEYIATHSYLMTFMMQIQKAISEPEGEPIKESKIIAPGSSSKIITDI